MTNQKEQQGTTKEQLIINEHAKTQFESLKSGGSHCVAHKGHGKTRLLFCIAENLIKNDSVCTIIFDGSETWLYSFSRIPVFNICEHDILSQQRSKTEDLEKYSLENENLVKLALLKNKNVLFILKTRKPSKRGFFIRTVVNYLDAMQREEKERPRAQQ